MNEKQKRIYGLLKQLNFENLVEHSEDSDNLMYCIRRALSYSMYIGITDTDFIPALQAFLREVEAERNEMY